MYDEMHRYSQQKQTQLESEIEKISLENEQLYKRICDLLDSERTTKEVYASEIEKISLENEQLYKRNSDLLDSKRNIKEVFENENKRFRSQNFDTHKRLLEVEDNTEFLVLSINTKEIRQDYDVTENVVLVMNGQFKNVDIVTRQGLSWKYVSNVKTYDELLALDQRKTIYYD